MTTWLRTALREAWSLFIDDLGLVIVALIAVLIAALLQGVGATDLAAPLLFAGLAIALLISVWRRARRKD